MEIIVTITNSKQIGFEEWKDYNYSKEFDENSTIKEIDDWAKENQSNFLSARFSTWSKNK